MRDRTLRAQLQADEIDGDLFPEDPEPARCPDCGCDLETEDHTIDCGYDDEDDDDDADDPEASDLNGL